jgi:hypothetical protein
MMRLDDPTELLGAWIGLNARIAERIADLHHVVLVAADHDPDAAALAADTDRQRALGNLEIVARLDELAALRPGLGLAHAAAIADTLIDPGLYRRLVRTHRWPFPHYLVHVRYLAITTLLDTRHHQPPPTLHEDRPER